MIPTYIKLPITFHTNDAEEVKKAEKMGIEVEKTYEEGFMYILATGDSCMYGFNDADDEKTNVRMYDGHATVYDIPIETFKAKLIKAGCVIIED